MISICFGNPSPEIPAALVSVILSASGAGLFLREEGNVQMSYQGFVAFLTSFQVQASMSASFDASAAEADALGFLALLPAILLILLVVLLSAYLRLSLHKATIVATIRQAHSIIKEAFPSNLFFISIIRRSSHTFQYHSQKVWETLTGSS